MSYQILFYKRINQEEVSKVGSLTPADEKTYAYFNELLSGANSNYNLSFISTFKTHPHGFLDLSLTYESILEENTIYVISDNYNFLTEEQLKNQDAINALMDSLPIEKIKKLFKENTDDKNL